MFQSAAVALLLSVVPIPGPFLDESDPAWDDATLNDVHFVDASTGWAVGDRGVIWHTRDGGQSWQLQPSGTICNLQSVYFVDDKTGWVVGGQSIPYSRGSRGLILATWDGGTTWQLASWDQFPRFKGVQFVDSKAGWAWGETSEFHPSGVFSSDNSGRLWQPASGAIGPGWSAGFFLSRGSGVLGGPGGVSALVQDRSLRPATVGTLGARSIRSMQFGGDGTGWAVADGGVVLRGGNYGAQWTAINAANAEHLATIFDWHNVHAIAGSAWIVGRPGTAVLQTDDFGRSWQLHATGVTVPLESVWFHDRQRGWAVGALGTILHTVDGGRTWQVQRRGGERAAILAVHGSAHDAPMLLHVQFGAEQGYLVSDLSVVTRRHDWDDLTRSGPESRLRDAVIAAGGSRSDTEWRFPANPLATSISQVLDDWNRRGEGKALQDLERRLVVAIRMWRPEVIVCDAPDPAVSNDAAAALVAQAVARAFDSAADASFYPELAELGRLEPWSAQKLYAVAPGANSASERIDASELSRSPWSPGRPLDDRASLALSLVADSYVPSVPVLHLTRLATRTGAARRDESLMDGIALEPGGAARRRWIAPVEISDAAQRAAQTHRNLASILSRAEGQPILARQLNAQLDGALRELGTQQAGNILYDLARTHFRAGRWSDTRELLEKLVQDHPDHLAATEAQRWLVQFLASSEARHRERLGGVVGRTTFELTERAAAADSDASPAPRQGDFAAQPQRGQPSSSVSTQRTMGAIGGMGSDVQWASGAVAAAKQLMQRSPLTWSDPTVQFPLASALRAIGNVKDAEKFYLTFALNRELGAWSEAARAERWLKDRQGVPSKPAILSLRTTVPPRLDGHFDDPVWNASTAVTLRDVESTPGEPWDTRLRIAHDAQYLYLALSCAGDGTRSAEPLRPRTRDMDLSQHDRVDLYLDLDRDYTTYYHLAVDERGCVSDDCWSDRSWDPNWYVASRNDERGYYVEAAIPFGELTDTAPSDGTVWVMNAVRVVPGKRLMAWSRPAAVAPRPEGMGYILFADAPAAPPHRAPVAN